MSKETKDKIVPKLRFPEFKDAGEWKEKSLEEVCEVITKGTTPEEFSDTGVRFIKIESFEENYIVPEKCVFINENTHKRELKRSILKEDDILFAIAGATIGKVNMVTKDLLPANTNQALAIVRLKERENKNFIFYILKSHLMQEHINKSISVGAQPNLNLEQMGNFSFAYPMNPQEQQKIASCLSSLDELIAAENQKLDALKTHKKGLMQQLFPTEGETVPKLRFAEFRDSGEWEENVLGGKGISIFVKERTTQTKLKLETYISTENLLADYGGVTIASKLPPAGSFTRFQKDDILISNIRPYLKKVWSANFDGAASNDVIVIRAGNFVNETFLSFQLKNDAFINFVMMGAKGVKMPRGDKSLMEEYPIKFPTKEEQQKIASCLSSLDELIAEQSQKTEALKVHKMGLMQGLFPAMSEL